MPVLPIPEMHYRRNGERSCSHRLFEGKITLKSVSFKFLIFNYEFQGRRGRLPSKPKSPQHSPPSPPVSLITALVRAHVDTSPDISTLNYSQYKEPSSTDVFESEAEKVQQFYSILTTSIDVIRQTADKIPGYANLLQEDQDLLFQSASLELFVLRLAYRVRSEDLKLTFCNGMVLHKEQCQRSFGEWLGAILEFSNNIHAMEIDISAFACLCALVVVTGKIDFWFTSTL